MSVIQSESQLKTRTWLDERLGLPGLRYAVPAHANSVGYLLGGVTLMGFIILIVTGVYLAQFYHAHPAEAHQSVIYMITTAPFGDIVRSVHFWAANIVTATVVLHLLRVLFTGSFKRPREINWYVGLGLLALTMGLVFTGTVLKWDQEGVEALAHNKEAGALLGALGAWFSPEFARSTPLLARLFNAHSSILPLLFGLLIAAHVYLIKQHGISPQATAEAKSRPTAGEGESRFSTHLRRMAGFGLLLLALTLLLALVWPAPLGAAGVSGVEVTRPPWMFIWLFPLEAIWGARALIFGPAALFVLLALVPILDRSPYLHIRQRKALLVVATLTLALILAGAIWGYAAPLAEHLE